MVVGKLPRMEEQTWNKIRGGMKGLLPSHIYHSFVEETSRVTLDGQTLQLSFPDTFSKENFEQKCLSALHDSLKALQLQKLRVVLSITAESASKEPYFFTEIFTPFDSKYSFENFVVGSTNQFAHAACQAVTKQPGQCYNPLFIFGGNGLGKTHLIKAIGHELSLAQKKLRVFYITSESFTNELIQAIQLNRMREFREKYRNGCDVLLLDDVHFLAGKERTQEEFFYTFNYLHESSRQIVITSDRYPKDIHGLEIRLQTRFEWGLVTDIQPPEMETRIAILRNKADKENINLPDEVAQYIALNMTSNIRELEGALHRLQAYASMTETTLSLELAQQLFKDITGKIKHELTPDAILKLVALQFNVKTTDIRSDKRIRKLSFPRQICMYLLRKHLLLSYPEIAKFIGGKDHTTVIYAVTKISELQKNDPETIKHITTIEGLIR